RVAGLRLEDGGGRPAMADAEPGRNAFARRLARAPGADFTLRRVALRILRAALGPRLRVDAVGARDRVLDAAQAEGLLVLERRRVGGAIPAVVDVVVGGGPVAARPGDDPGFALQGQVGQLVLEIRGEESGVAGGAPGLGVLVLRVDLCPAAGRGESDSGQRDDLFHARRVSNVRASTSAR